MLLPKMAIIGNNNNNSQIIAKVGNKMVTLSLYRNLSHIFAILATFCFQKLPKMAIFIDLKVAKNGKWTYLAECHDQSIQGRQIHVYKAYCSPRWNFNYMSCEGRKIAAESRCKHRSKKYENDPNAIHGPPDHQSHFKQLTSTKRYYIM